MTKTKIDWADYVWNPVWGCNRACPYCYARGIAKRFGESAANREATYLTPDNVSTEVWEKLYNDILNRVFWFKPTWLESNFQKEFPKKPSRIFVNSMSDICYWENEWIEKVLEKIYKNDQHQFFFLTKDDSVYDRADLKETPDHIWLGTTITNDKEQRFIAGRKTFLSVEPIMGQYADWAIVQPDVDWVIIGAETGNRKGKVIPQYRWIDNIVTYCQARKIPVFLKSNLKEVWKGPLIQEIPK